MCSQIDKKKRKVAVRDEDRLKFYQITVSVLGLLASNRTLSSVSKGSDASRSDADCRQSLLEVTYSIPTELKLYNTCILPIFLHGSECWAVTKVDARRIDALDQWCLRTMLGIKWHQFVHNEMRRITNQLPQR